MKLIEYISPLKGIVIVVVVAVVTIIIIIIIIIIIVVVVVVVVVVINNVSKAAGCRRFCNPLIPKGLFTWREEDPSTRKILQGGSTFHLLYMQKFWSEWLPSGEGKEEKLSAFSS